MAVLNAANFVSSACFWSRFLCDLGLGVYRVCSISPAQEVHLITNDKVSTVSDSLCREH